MLCGISLQECAIVIRLPALNQSLVEAITRIFILVICCACFIGSVEGMEAHSAPTKNSNTAISGNPGAVNIETGTGALGRAMGLKDGSGIRLGGLWIGDLNYLITGGIEPKRWSDNSLFQLSLSADTEKLGLWKGGLFEVEFLQFNGQPTNAQAGSVQGYNGLPASPPFDRSELYQLWYRQELFNKKLIVRIGKSVQILDFNNVLRPLALEDPSLAVPAISGLIYTPIFVNTTMLGVLPGYYNSAYGITTTIAPVKSAYFSYGIYDGNLARGRQTGLRGPEFNGNYFQIAEGGFAWQLGKDKMPGMVAVGVWEQTGELTTQDNKRSEKGACGIYLFGSQRLWIRHPGKDSSGIIAFYQWGHNRSTVLPMNDFFGGGLTFLGLVEGRPVDSFGAGIAWSKLNKRLFVRQSELMLQGYYQMHLYESVFFEPVISYIPSPGAAPNVSSVWAGTFRVVALF